MLWVADLEGSASRRQWTITLHPNVIQKWILLISGQSSQAWPTCQHTDNSVESQNHLLNQDILKQIIIILSALGLLTSCTHGSKLPSKDIESYQETIKARASWQSASLSISEKIGKEGKTEEANKLRKLSEEHSFFITCLERKQSEAIPYKKGNKECHEEKEANSK